MAETTQDGAMNSDAAMINITICYARPGLQVLRPLQVAPQTTIQQAVLQSAIMQDVPEIDISTARVGIFGKLKSLDTLLRENDRIEIYRPLIADPKEARRKRAVKK